MTEIELSDNFKTSMSVADLNDLVVKLRQPVKKSRTQVIQKLTRKIKQLKSKKGDESQIEKNNKKATRCLKQITVLKNAEIDNLIKFCLRYKPGNLKSQFLEPSEVDAYARIANHKIMNKKVGEWRNKHDDWESLANFISEHISRRLKSKPRKSVLKNIPGTSPEKSQKEDNDLSTNEDKVLSTNTKNIEVEKKKKVSSKTLSTSTCPTQKPPKQDDDDEKMSEDEIPKQLEYTCEMSGMGGFIQNICLDENISDELTITVTNSAGDESITKDIKKKKISFFEGKDETEESEVVEGDDPVDAYPESDMKKKNHATNKINNKRKFTDSSKGNKEFGFQPTIPNVKFHTKAKNYEKHNRKNNEEKEKLHPSWEAKRRLNEKLALQPQCKRTKIIFND